MTGVDVDLTMAWPAGLVLAAIFSFVAVLLERRAGRSRGATTLRATLVALVGLALARPELVRRGAGPAAWIVEQSLVANVSAALEEGGRSGEDAAVLLAFGGEDLPRLDAAIEMGAQMLPRGGRLAVVGTGSHAGSDPEASVHAASRAGVAVDAVYVAAAGPDAAVTALEVPVAWRANRPVPIAVALRADRPVTATLTLVVDGAESVRHEGLHIDGNVQRTVREAVTGRSQGMLAIEARLETEGDVETSNDAAGAVVRIAPPPRVLVVSEDEGGLLLATALQAADVRSERIAPAQLPSRMDELAAWDVLALVDVPAAALGVDQLTAVEAFAAELGRGVILTAGRQSYLAGGWAATSLARLAPVDLRPPAREARDPVALVLMVDESASMGTLQGRTSISKLDLALEAAVLASGVLRDGDWIGVVAYADRARWVLAPVEVGVGAELAEVEGALRGLTSGGGTSLAAALELGLPVLTELPVAVRHAVLISDGRDYAPDAARNEQVVREAQGTGATLSTIAVGFDADRPLLARLARIGRGRSHVADSAAELPRLTLEESEILSAHSEQSGDFGVQVGGDATHAVVAGVDVNRLPRLDGYVAVTARSDAQVALSVAGGDPLLATWNYGLGRVAAWLTDVGESWAWDWPEAPEASALWAAVADYVAPAPGGGPPGISVTCTGGATVVEADTLDAAGRALDLAEASLTLTSSGTTTEFGMLQTAPGVYSVGIPSRDRDAGGLVRIQSDRADLSAPAALSSRCPAAPVPPIDGRRRLAQLAALGGGEMRTELDLPGEPASRLALAPWLISLALLFLLVDIAEQLGLFGTGSRLSGIRGRRPWPSAGAKERGGS